MILKLKNANFTNIKAIKIDNKDINEIRASNNVSFGKRNLKLAIKMIKY